jgi:hypothetical protein
MMRSSRRCSRVWCSKWGAVLGRGTPFPLPVVVTLYLRLGWLGKAFSCFIFSYTTHSTPLRVTATPVGCIPVFPTGVSNHFARCAETNF